MFCIEGPTFRVRGVESLLADQRQTLQLQRDRNLEMMSGNTFVVGKRLHAPRWGFVQISQVREKGSWPGAVHRCRLVVSTRGAFFLRGRNALDGQALRWQRTEVFRHARLNIVQDLLIA